MFGNAALFGYTDIHASTGGTRNSHNPPLVYRNRPNKRRPREIFPIQLARSVSDPDITAKLDNYRKAVHYVDSRRKFMDTKSTRRTFFTGLSAPLILGATNKSGSHKPILGEGDHKYECTHDWGELPATIKYGNTHGVCEDSKGHIYIHHTVGADSELNDSMVVFDHKGKFVKSWGREFKGGAHGLTIRREGSTEYLYLSDIKRGLVVKTTLNGEEVFTLGYPKEAEPYAKPGPDGKPLKYSPTNLAIAPNGDIYVGDGYGSSYVNVYSSKGEYKFTFGGPGKEAGKLDCPHGIICDERGAQPIMTIADRGNNRIQNFTLEGKHIEFVGGTNLPCYFDFYNNGDVVVPD